MSYVDGFVLVVPKKKIAIYKKHGDRRPARSGASTARSTTASASATTSR